MRTFVVAVNLALALTAPAAAAPCGDLAACQAACKDGAGDLAACAVVADALVVGAKVAPDRSGAAILYRAACGLGAGPEGPAAAGDPDACMALADLTRTGWLFEVELDPALHRALVDRTVELAATRCTADDPSGCAAAARAARERVVLAPETADATAPARYAELGCGTGHDPAACRVLHDLAASAATESEASRLRGVARAGVAAGCTTDGAAAACRAADLSDAKVRAAAEKLCARGEVAACVAVDFQGLRDHRRDPDQARTFAAHLIAACAGDGHDLCAGLASRLIRGGDRFGIAADPATGVAIGERRCALGDREACRVVADALGPDGPDDLRDAAKGRSFADRACDLTAPDRACRECAADPALPACVRRQAFAEHERCVGGDPAACGLIAARFRDGVGVPADPRAAARYLRRGCDAADKPACVALDELCVAHPDLPDDACAQALVHTDLFYAAEYQADQGAAAALTDPHAPAPTQAPTPGAIAVGGGDSGPGVRLERGKLDADLVVDIVLDRARQAAISLVVDELVGAGKHARYRYLQDLLAQGSRLLADPSTLRREKFLDLGMTVVRAFVAANLVDGRYPSADALAAAPVIGPVVVGHLGLAPGGDLPGPVRGYLVDVAYRWLGDTPLFARAPEAADAPVACPWPDGAGAALCSALAPEAAVERALGLDLVMDGLRLAKALRDGGFDELRRLIEAVSRSRTIASFESTPGLGLAAWRSFLVAGARERIARVRAQLADLRTLVRPATFADAGPDLAGLAARAASARAVLDAPALVVVIGRDRAERLARIVGAIERAAPKLEPDAAVAPAAAPDALAKARKAAAAELAAWGTRELTALGGKLDGEDAELDAIRKGTDDLETAIAELAAVFAAARAGAAAGLDVGSLPLYAIGDLARAVRAARAALTATDDHLRRAFPGEVNAQLQLARSATARLLGFLDLMQRVARSSALTRTCGDIVKALGSLGSRKRGEFAAPLYDVLEPVLAAIKTHEPMSLDLVFQVIARVRLDTLIRSLQGRGDACKDDGGVECWTVKLVHALQESVERDGELIRIDGGKFAQRLARHGDDFRHRHTWRGFFHLTVGFGALRSAPIDAAAADRRVVPLVSEQIGAGWASPSFAGDRLTFKIGAAASGLLYRAVLDSKESEAIMVHPVFFAVDLGDLIEAYVSPAMLLVYPPSDTRGTEVRWGIGAGLSVPLSSYLERL